MPRWRRLIAPFPLALLAFALLPAIAPANARAELPPLIPRSVLWSYAERGGATLSPGGRSILFNRRSAHGITTLWLRDVATRAERGLTDDRTGNVFVARWTPDSRRVLYLKDSDGDENSHLFMIDLASGQTRDLTPFAGARAQDMMLDALHPNQLLVGLNLLDRRVADLYRIDLETGAVRLDTKNPGDVSEWCVDSTFTVRACASLDSNTANTVIRVRDGAKGLWRTLQVWPFERTNTDREQRLIRFSRGGRGLVVLSPLGSKTTRFVTLDTRTAATLDSLSADPRADVNCPFDFFNGSSGAQVLVQPRTGAIQAWTVEYLKPEWKVVDASLKGDIATLEGLHRGVLQVNSRDDADRLWTVSYLLDNGATAHFLWDRASQKAESLWVDHPEFATLALAEQKGIVIRARDGLEIPCYLTLPVGVPAKNLPLVVNPHGGPNARDDWGFYPDVQWLANRGYAVLQPEFRGTTGLGAPFLAAGTGGWGVGSMQDDITDAVRWAIREGIADSSRVAIYGISYGGYATLAGLAFTPELYTCGVDMVGPSDVKALLQSIPPYWKLRLRRWLNRIGDVLTDDALNQRISPLYHVDAMRAPLMIGHGVNDPRVKIANSERIVAALRARGTPVSFIVYPDEGHGFSRSENNQDFYGRMEEFLGKYLHGRIEPWQKVDGSTAEVR